MTDLTTQWKKGQLPAGAYYVLLITGEIFPDSYSPYDYFEQSGTFKNEFIKLGYQAEDYDTQNDFGQTDNVIDLFSEIEKGYNSKPSIFDNIKPSDLIIAFFPCIYFTGSVNPCYYTLENHNYKGLTVAQKFNKILEQSRLRQRFFELLYMLVGVCMKNKLRIVIENPYDDSMHYLKNNFLSAPSVYDRNRLLRGDCFKKPTGYWFFGCEPTYGESYQNDKKAKRVWDAERGKKAGLCSKGRSMISPDYARNWICDFILGKKQNFGQQDLFEV